MNAIYLTQRRRNKKRSGHSRNSAAALERGSARAPSRRGSLLGARSAVKISAKLMHSNRTEKERPERQKRETLRRNSLRHSEIYDMMRYFVLRLIRIGAAEPLSGEFRSRNRGDSPGAIVCAACAMYLTHLIRIHMHAVAIT